MGGIAFWRSRRLTWTASSHAVCWLATDAGFSYPTIWVYNS